MHGGNGNKFWLCVRKGVGYYENAVVDGRVLKLILRKQWEDVDWIHLAQVNGRWTALCRRC
jgi:hypothetical protein